MKKIIGLVALLLACCTAKAQLPEKFAIIAGGGVSWPYVKQFDYDFYNKYGNRAGYNLLAEGRYYFANDNPLALGVGLAFDYINHNAHGDKQHAYFGRPEFIIRFALDDDDRQALFFNLGAGLMHYEEKMDPILDGKGGTTKEYAYEFHRNYFAFGTGVGYEFALGKGFGVMLRFDYSCAGIFWNEKARVIDVYDNPYDDADHKWLKSRVQYFNLSLALQFGQ